MPMIKMQDGHHPASLQDGAHLALKKFCLGEFGNGGFLGNGKGRGSGARVLSRRSPWRSGGGRRLFSGNHIRQFFEVGAEFV